MQLYWSGPGIARQLIPDAVFSTSGTPPPASTTGLTDKYFEGDFNILPDFNSLTPVKTGTTTNVDIGIRPSGVNDHFAFVWEGYINIPAQGSYEFRTLSDDGSRVFINGEQVINNNGIYAARSENGNFNAPAAGLCPITIQYFEKDGGEIMELYWASAEFSTRRVPDEAFSLSGSGFTATKPLFEKATINAITSEDSFETRTYPNPFRESFNIEFHNTSSVNKIQMGIYDLKGQLVYMKNVGSVAAGRVMLQVKPDGKLLPGGIYIARLQVNGLPQKMIKLVKVK